MPEPEITSVHIENAVPDFIANRASIGGSKGIGGYYCQYRLMPDQTPADILVMLETVVKAFKKSHELGLLK